MHRTAQKYNFDKSLRVKHKLNLNLFFNLFIFKEFETISSNEVTILKSWINT